MRYITHVLRPLVVALDRAYAQLDRLCPFVVARKMGIEMPIRPILSYRSFHRRTRRVLRLMDEVEKQ